MGCIYVNPMQHVTRQVEIGHVILTYFINGLC